jgi:hypothetical protein
VLSLGCAAILWATVQLCDVLQFVAKCRWQLSRLRCSVITLGYGGVLGVYGQVAVEVLSASVLVARGVGVPGVVQ